MNSFTEQYGFDDHLFLCETPDFLRCVVCSLVLRDPVQILTCGHKFCSKCFDWMKSYAESKNTEFCCPVDRDVVDMTKVHEDVAVKREVGNLRTRCEAHKEGCSWNGDLRDLEKHSKQCSYQQHKHLPKGATVVTNEMIQDLYNKVARFETWMADRDREMADKDKENISLKYQVQQLSEELHSLKRQIQDEYATRDEVTNLKKELKEQKDFAESLEAENKLLETEVESLTTQLVSSHQQHNNSSCQSTSMSKKLEASKLTTKNIVIQRHRGDHDDVVFSGQGNSCVQFKGFSTVSIPTVSVGRGIKAWYEVKITYKDVDSPHFLIGWASISLTKIDRFVNKGVGSVSQSYGFNPLHGLLASEGQYTEYEYEYPFIVGTEGNNYVGVALDMVEGRVSYSVNGVWFHTDDTEVGNNFNCINLNTVFFPALSGIKGTVEVNFGDKLFKYGPPDQAYSSLLEIA